MGETPYTTYQGKLDILRSAAKALQFDITNKIVCILIGNQIGSGICVKIGPHYFIATAAHVLEPTGDIYVMGEPYSKDAEPRTIKPIHCGEDKSFDVAYLELEESDALRLQTTFLELENLSIQSDMLDDLALVTGFPAKYFKTLLQGNTIIICGIFFLGIPIYPTGNPAKLNDLEYPHSKANPEHHIVVDWPEDDEFILGEIVTNIPKRVYEIGTIELPKPRGISGGGIWEANINTDGIWSPKLAKLVVNTHWNHKKRYVKGTKIHYWLSLVGANYCDIQSIIQNIG